jgi:hypothetical protein
VTAVHCAAHRVSLACKSFADNEVYALVDYCLRASYNIFARSPIAVSQLSELQEFYGSVKNRLLRIHDIRWLSVHKVLDRWIEQFDNLLIHVVTRGVADPGLCKLSQDMLDV